MPAKTEGFGVSTLEALSAGLPVLVNSNSGLAEALKEVPLGSQCVVDSEDPKEWAEKIKEVRQKKKGRCDFQNQGFCVKSIWRSTAGRSS